MDYHVPITVVWVTITQGSGQTAAMGGIVTVTYTEDMTSTSPNGSPYVVVTVRLSVFLCTIFPLP
jgi:hypothetical protein